MLKTYYFLISIILFCFSVKANRYEVLSSESTKFKRGGGAEAILQNVKINIDVNVNDLVNTVFELSGKAINIVYTPNEVTDIRPGEGGRWISINSIESGHLMSAYFHPSQRHYARAVGKTDPGRSYGDAGEWAVAVAPRKLKGNKTYYNVVEDSSSMEAGNDNENENENEIGNGNVLEFNEEVSAAEQNDKQEKDSNKTNGSEPVNSGIESLKYFSLHTILLIMALCICTLF